MNVSEKLLQILDQEKIKHIFGVAGDALNPLVSALSRQENIDWVRVKHEGNASYAAFAQAALTGNLGVCASTVGPGALHLVNGLYNAKKERAPVVAITGQISPEKRGTGFFQEVDLEKMFDDICEYQAIIRTAGEAEMLMQKAIRIALNYKTVCRIELSPDIAAAEVPDDEAPPVVFRSESLVIPPDKQLKESAQLIDDAKKVAILAGAGCRDARKEVLEFAGRLNAPITHTLRASDVFDHHTRHVVGLTGLIGNDSGYRAVMDCDLLIMLGTNFPYTDYLPEDTRVIQVDIRPENIGNRINVTLGMQGDIRETIRRLTPMCREKKERGFLDGLEETFTKWKSSHAEKEEKEKDLKPMHPQLLASQLSRLASDNAIFAIETGTSAIWSSNYMSFHSDRRIVGSFNHGSMAVGLPAAIGAQMAFPDCEVWAMVGDGAFHMTLHEFSTAADYGLPIKVVVFNNSELGFVKIEMEEAGLAPNFDALGVRNFDFAEFARICGGDGVTISCAEEVGAAIQKAKSSGVPFIINAKVTKGELSVPPGLDAGQVTNFGISKARELLKAIGGDREQWENLKKEVEAFFK